MAMSGEPTTQPCKTCGTCPTCGRQPNQFSPEWGYWPQPYISPIFWTTPPQMPYYRPTLTWGSAQTANGTTLHCDSDAAALAMPNAPIVLSDGDRSGS